MISAHEGGGGGTPRTALVMLGCPQLCAQTSGALFLLNELAACGIDAMVAGTPSACAHLAVADPAGHYLGAHMDIDECIAELAEGEQDYDFCFVFIHNDAGVAYAATLASISGGATIALIFGEHAEELASGLEGIRCEKHIIRGGHNPLPMKRTLREVVAWVALKN
ncbi:MAG TPA: DUF1890 domain-containing protein [Methanoculleus sp.]|nr:DUF1890 domain-containing protein [Methanoculleus sp.]